ncbi:MAG TPA: hypothetical protein VMU20_14715 [Candidatus Dormibacteraeota bacterium]|jgi:hypothetical protein|nr:hypothetical protein [Candidatus Dormibacteraeota bacterium]
MRTIAVFAVLTAAGTGAAMGVWEALRTRLRCTPSGSCALVHPRTVGQAVLIGLLTTVCLLGIDTILLRRVQGVATDQPV